MATGDEDETSKYSWNQLIDQLVEISDQNSQDESEGSNDNYVQDEQKNNVLSEEELDPYNDVKAETDLLDDEDISEETI